MRQMIRSAALLLAVVLWAGLASPAEAVGSAQVRSFVDHNARTITFKVDLYLYPACDRPSCQITDGVITTVKAEIEQAWNKRNKFRCYDIRVVVKVTKGTGGPSSVPDGKVGVRIDRSSVNFVSFVTTDKEGGQWKSDEPRDRLVPVNDETSPTTWGYPASTNTYAHEFGHILGLDDTYRNDATGRSVDIPGAPHDLMNTGMFESNAIAQETIDRLAKRAGINEANLRCGWIYYFTDPLETLDGMKCDGIAGEWVITGQGNTGGMLSTSRMVITIDERTMRGTYTYKGVSRPPGGGSVTYERAGQATLSFDPSGVAKMALVETKSTMTIKVPGGTQRQNLPLEPDEIVWEKAGQECAAA